MTDAADLVVFDLDDTLYLERDYVRSGFRAVADELAVVFPALRERSFDMLWADFNNGIRGSSFDRLASALPQIVSILPVDRMIAIYRGHTPDIAPLAGAEPLLRALEERKTRRALITDGRACQQIAKLDALRLRSYFDRIVVNEAADRFKPDCRSFRQMQHELGAEDRRCWYVADNPAKDFIAPRRLGWRSVRLKTPGQLREGLDSTGPAADFTIGDLNGVLAFVTTTADKTTACS